MKFEYYLRLKGFENDNIPYLRAFIIIIIIEIIMNKSINI